LRKLIKIKDRKQNKINYLNNEVKTLKNDNQYNSIKGKILYIQTILFSKKITKSDYFHCPKR
jgi:hypothetical protein